MGREYKFLKEEWNLLQNLFKKQQKSLTQIMSTGKQIPSYVNINQPFCCWDVLAEGFFSRQCIIPIPHQLKQPGFFIFQQWCWTFIYIKGKLLRKSILPEGLYTETMPWNICLVLNAQNFSGWCFQRCCFNLFMLFSLGIEVRVTLRHKWACIFHRGRKI